MAHVKHTGPSDHPKQAYPTSLNALKVMDSFHHPKCCIKMVTLMQHVTNEKTNTYI